MSALSAEVLRKINDFVLVDVPQESYAVVWSLWRTFDSVDVGTAFEKCLTVGFFSDVLVHGLLLSICEWYADAREERRLHMAMGRGLPMSALRWLYLHDEAHHMPTPMVFESMYHMYRKLSKCVDYITVGVSQFITSSSSHVLGQIESFGQNIGQWLKVAGGDKASLTECALEGRKLQKHEISAEFGAFIGYSSIRFARCILANQSDNPGLSWQEKHASPVGASFEVDPVHALVARHFINLANLSSAAEVWLGLLQDTLSLLPERTSENSKAFSFMDQRGTTFHSDFALLERMCSFAMQSVATADNVNKPGAPIFLWHMTRNPYFDTVLWSMNEFASDTIEDWQSVCMSK